jgi:imidazolonepropionase-like amidohydrolase
MAAALDCIEHLANCDVAWREATQEEDDELIDLMLQHEVAIDPTMVIWDRSVRGFDMVFGRDESRHWAHPAHRHYWESGRLRAAKELETRLKRQQEISNLKRFLGRAHERGVTVAIGTDSPFPRLTPGFSVHDEMGVHTDAGIAPVDVLRSATSVNARVLAIDDRTGRIAPGLDADLVAIRGNPLDDIRQVGNIEMVARRGQVLDSDKLRHDVEATFDETPDDAITQDLLDRLKMD